MIEGFIGHAIINKEAVSQTNLNYLKCLLCSRKKINKNKEYCHALYVLYHASKFFGRIVFNQQGRHPQLQTFLSPWYAHVHVWFEIRLFALLTTTYPFEISAIINNQGHNKTEYYGLANALIYKDGWGKSSKILDFCTITFPFSLSFYFLSLFEFNSSILALKRKYE